MAPCLLCAVLLCLLMSLMLVDSRVRASKYASSSLDSHFSSLVRRLSVRECNSFNPKCNLTASEAQTRHLTSYKDLVKTLQQLSIRAKLPISVGPLVKNGDNGGLIDIDAELDKSLASAVNVTVCGEGTTPTIREAVVCTVSRSDEPTRGNTESKRIGFSNQGRELWGARLGNAGGMRVFVLTQIHGNAAASTEAALRLLHMLTRWKRFARPIRKKLDILFLVRANIDGGEPSAPNFPQIGVPYTDKWGFFTQNIDLSAGGGFQAASEKGFLGVVGRGYDLNRYNYGGLGNPIRPVESQAIVATMHAFRPEIVFDMHGDQPKVKCDLDASTLKPGVVQGILPTIECKKPGAAVPTLLTQRESMVIGGFFASDASSLSGAQTAGLKSGPRYMRNTRLVRSIAAEAVRRAGRGVVGTFTRFSQVEISGVNELRDATADQAALALGAIGSGWEVLNFGVDVRAAVSSMEAGEGGALKANVGFDLHLIEPCFLQDNICIHERLLRQALEVTASLVGEKVDGDNGFCALPLHSGVLVSLPERLGWSQGAIEEAVLVPEGGTFGVPSRIFGRCAGDP